MFLQYTVKVSINLFNFNLTSLNMKSSIKDKNMMNIDEIAYNFTHNFVL